MKFFPASCLLFGLLCLPLQPPAAATLDPALLKNIQSATFEVVLHKPENSPVTYVKPLPLDQLPFQERNDKYYSIGTAFEISPAHYVTAFHVMQGAIGGLLGPPALRDAAGRVYAIDQITRFSLQQDFVEFTLTTSPGAKPLPTNRTPELNTVVYAVGNALGTGVVIRDGLLTSQTPEDQDGRWKWLRFSAAASPGNSGGPLLDGSGEVIGVVLMKSANENLNYALPIDEVLKASSVSSHLDQRLSFSLGLTPDTQSGLLRGDIALPLSYAAFAQTMERHDTAFYIDTARRFLADQRDSIFPRGDGSHDPLARRPTVESFPEMLQRQADGRWRRVQPQHASQPLPDNGYVDAGLLGSAIVFHLRKPDSLSLKQLYAKPKTMMDLLLKSGNLTRSIAGEKIAVTSLGVSTSNQSFTDAYQRYWSVNVFAMPWENKVVMVAMLPVPDGYAGVMLINDGRQRGSVIAIEKIMADFFNAGYDGSFAAWKEFLSSGAKLPDAITQSSLNIDYGKRFSFTSPAVSLAYTPALQKIDADGELALYFSFVPIGDHATWQVRGVMAQPDINKHDMVRIDYFPAPYADLGQAFQSGWKDLLNRSYPQNSQPYERDGMKWIGTVAGATAAMSLTAKPNHVYTVFYGVDGSLPDAVMKQKLKLALQGTSVH